MRFQKIKYNAGKGKPGKIDPPNNSLGTRSIKIKKWLIEMVAGDGFPYGYKKCKVGLKEDYFLIINHNKKGL